MYNQDYKSMLSQSEIRCMRKVAFISQLTLTYNIDYTLENVYRSAFGLQKSTPTIFWTKLLLFVYLCLPSNHEHYYNI